MTQLEGGKTYKLINVKGETALDLSGTDNSSIIGWGPHDGSNQRWLLEWTGHHWTFKNVGNGRYLGIDGEPKDNTRLIAVDDRVEWDIWPDEKDRSVYRIFVPGHPTPINIDLSDYGNPSPGTPVTLWGKWHGTNQTWRFEEV